MSVTARGGGPQHRLSPKAQALVNRISATNRTIAARNPFALLAGIGQAPKAAGTDHAREAVYLYENQPSQTGINVVDRANRRAINQNAADVGAGRKPRNKLTSELDAANSLANTGPSKAVRAIVAPVAPRFAPHGAQQAGILPDFGEGHLIGQTLNDLAAAALGTPAGLAATAMHPVRVAKGIGAQVKQDAEHPLRHPGFTGLDLLGAASLGAGMTSRLGAASGELAAGEGVRSAAHAFVKPPIPERTLTYKPEGTEGVTAHPLASENPLSRVVQRAHDKIVQGALDNPQSLLHGAAVKRVGRELGHADRQGNLIETAPGLRSIQANKKLTDAERALLVNYHEGTHPLLTARAHRDWAAQTSGLIREQNLAQAKIHEQAAALLGHGQPLLGWDLPSNLHAQYDVGAKAGLAREDIMRDAGREPSAERVHGPARVIAGAEHVKKTPGRLGVPSQSLIRAQARVERVSSLIERAKSRPLVGPNAPVAHERDLIVSNLKGALAVAEDDVARLKRSAAARVTPTGLLGAEDVTSGRGYVPHTAKQRLVPGVPRFGGRKSVGISAEPGSLTHEFTGGLLKQGARRLDFNKLMGESQLEAQRYFGPVLKLRERAKAVAQATPDGIPAQHAIPVRLDNLKHDPLPALVKQATGEHALPAGEMDARRRSLLKEVFPLHGAKGLGDLTHHEQAAFQRLHEEGKIGWVDKRLLGPQADAIPSLPLTRSFASANNLIKGGMIYGNPGHVLTRNASNLGMTVMRQGVFAPVNIIRALRLRDTLNADDLAKVRAATGSGSYFHALNADEGLGKKALNTGAHYMHKLADERYRDAAFIHQARLAGFSKAADLHRLLNDKALAPKLNEISRRANDDIVDYGRLGPKEKQILGRAVFVYPWVKGSTRFYAQTLAHHPAVGAAQMQVGRQGEKFIQEKLGKLPSYLEGSFGLGGKLVDPEVANPIGTAARVMHTVADFPAGKATQSELPGNYLNPLTQSGAALAFGATSFGKSTVGQKPLNLLFSQLGQEMPAVQAGVRAEHGNNPNKLFQYTPKLALERLLGGAPTPRQYNPTILHQQATKDELSVMAPDEKIKYKTAQAVGAVSSQWKLLAKQHPDVFTKKALDAINVSYQRDQERQLAYLAAAKKAGVSAGRLPAVDKLIVTAELATKYGYPKADAAKLVSALEKARKDPKLDLSGYSKHWLAYFDREFLYTSYRNSWTNYLKKIAAAKKS